MTPIAAAATTIATDSVHDDSRRPTRVTVDRADGRARIRRLDPGAFMVARPLQVRGNHVRIALVGNRMSLLGGDTIDLRVRVGGGVTLEVVEPVGTVAYDADGQRADWRLFAAVAHGAMLIWHGNQFVAAQGSNAHRCTQLTLDHGARALLKETLVLGRSRETAVCLQNSIRVCLQQRELLVEDLDVGAHTRQAPGVVGTARAVSTVTAAGWRPPGEGADAHRLDLAGPGALQRALDAAAHRAEGMVAPVFEQWRKQLFNTGL